MMRVRGFKVSEPQGFRHKTYKRFHNFDFKKIDVNEVTKYRFLEKTDVEFSLCFFGNIDF